MPRPTGLASPGYVTISKLGHASQQATVLHQHATRERAIADALDTLIGGADVQRQEGAASSVRQVATPPASEVVVDPVA